MRVCAGWFQGRFWEGTRRRDEWSVAGGAKGGVLAAGGSPGGEGRDEKACGLSSRDPSVWH